MPDAGEESRHGHACGQLAPELRSFPEGNYLIFYKPIHRGIVVVRVLSGYRDIEALLGS